MKKKEHINATDLSGLAYVKDSKGRPDNINFFTNVTVNTSDNTATINYTVSVFSDRKDAFRLDTFDYNEAVDKYNELAKEYDAHRDIN